MESLWEIAVRRAADVYVVRTRGMALDDMLPDDRADAEDGMARAISEALAGMRPFINGALFQLTSAVWAHARETTRFCADPSEDGIPTVQRLSREHGTADNYLRDLLDGPDV